MMMTSPFVRLAPIAVLIVLLMMVVSRQAGDIAGHRDDARRAAALVELARGIEHLSKAAQNLAFERGRTNVVLRAVQPASADNRLFIDTRRREGREQLQRSLALLTPHLPSQCEDLRRQADALEALRGIVDADLALPRERRRDGIADGWFTVASQTMQTIMAVLSAATEHVGTSDATFAAFSRVALLSLQFRDTAGLESTTLAAALAEGRPDQPLRLRLATLRAQGDMLLLALQREMAALPGDSLHMPREAIRSGLSDNLRPLQDRILAAWDAGQPAGVQVREYTQASVAGLDAIVALTAAAIHEAGAHAGRRAEAAQRAAKESAAFLAVLALAVAALALLLPTRRGKAPAAAATAEPAARQPVPGDGDDLRKAVEQLDIGVARLDGNGRILWVNACLEGLLGRPAAALLGRRLTDLLPDLEGAGRLGPWIFPLRQGETGPVLALHLIDGDPPLACLRDASLLAAAQAERDRFARLLEGCSAGIVQLSREGCITFANPAAQCLLETPSERLLGRYLEDVRESAAELTVITTPLHPGDPALGAVATLQARAKEALVS